MPRSGTVVRHQAAIALSAIAIAAWFSAPAAAAPGGATGTTGRISGTVTAGAAPVAGICVLAEPFGSAGTSSAFGFDVTNAQGRYTATGLPAGQYQVEFYGGCGNSGSYASQYYQADQYVPGPVPVTKGQATTGIDAAMQPGATLTGRVTGPSGAAAHGICVIADPGRDAPGGGLTPEELLLPTSLPASAQFTRSGRTGRYRLANLNPGRYEIAFSSCAGQGGQYAARWFHPGGGAGPAWIELPGGQSVSASAALAPAGSISGVVRSVSGKPVAGICPAAVGRSGQVPSSYSQINPVSPVRGSNRQGTYQISGLAAGQYAVSFFPCYGDQPGAPTWFRNAARQAGASPVTVRPGRATANIDPVLSPGQLVAGLVRSGLTGRPLRGECVTAFGPDGTLLASTVTGGQGGYSFPHLPPGHDLIAVLPCLGGHGGLADTQRPVTLTASRPRPGFDLTLAASGTITGTVSSGDPAASAAGVCVEALPRTGHGMPGIGVTGNSGSYAIGGLAPGSYQVRFTATCPGGSGAYLPQWYNGQSSRAKARRVPVTSTAATSGISASLAAAGGISGTVQVSGLPAAGVCAIASPASGSGGTVIAATAADGSYQVSGLAPGSYLVEFTAGCGNSSYQAQWYDAQPTATTATAVPVTAATVTTGIDAS